MLKDEIINRVLNSMKMLDGEELTMLRGVLLVALTALRKGMPIEQVQLMLGHEQIDTTMIYAKTDTKSVKYSHDKYM